MGLYSPGSTPLRPQLLQMGGLRGERTRVRDEVAVPASEWLASVNLSQSENSKLAAEDFAAAEGRRHQGHHHGI